MDVHFIAIGGSAMHNLAIALHKKGYHVTGSDDEIFDPSRQRLAKYGLLPDESGWFPGKLNHQFDAVILGMHARADNPELLRARELGLKVFSYPEYLYEQSKDKTRVVIGGSHGKTTITAMILHVLNYYGIHCDYMVGAQLEGFEVMVKLSEDAPYMVIEGDEYLSSPIDLRPKFHLYKPHIAFISGIAWDHINVFPSFEIYVDQFRKFIHCIEDEGKLIYCQDDSLVKALCEQESPSSVHLYPYGMPDFDIVDGQAVVSCHDKKYPLQVFGRHNLLNMSGALTVCMQMGVSSDMFCDAIMHFKGASRRLERIFSSSQHTAFRDFAHAPSKIKASTDAAKDFFPEKQLIACVELHTYSSLNRDFLSQYKGSLDKADKAFIFYNPHALSIKKLPEIDADDILQAFDKPGAKVFSEIHHFMEAVADSMSVSSCLLLMSSGDFAGFDFSSFLSKWEDK